jgi:tetratricopeptide (TPR) repeat protein
VQATSKFAISALGSLLLALGVQAQRAGATSAPPNPGGSRIIGRDTSPLNPENSLEIIKPPAPAEEKAYKAFKSFQSVSNEDLEKKTRAGEEFLKKYPNTQYTAFVYSYLMVAYIQAGSPEQGLAAGEKVLQINPADYRTMAVLSQALSRMANDGTPNQADRLTKAESYGQGALDGVAKMQKPEGVSDANFASSKNATLAMAHSGLGLVEVHKNDYASAIAQLEAAIKLNDSDMTNFYLLGVASQNSEHYDKAVTAFEKCSAVQGNLQAPCSSGLQQAKKDAALHPAK